MKNNKQTADIIIHPNGIKPLATPRKAADMAAPIGILYRPTATIIAIPKVQHPAIYPFILLTANAQNRNTTGIAATIAVR